MTALDLVLSFLVTWTVILSLPTAIRAIRKRPLEKGQAIGICAILYFVDVVIFAALGSQSKSHLAVLIGAFVSYYVLRWQTKTSAVRTTQEQRKALGYDEAP